MLRRRRTLRVAPLHRRLMAQAIDLLLMFVGIVPAVGVISLIERRRRARAGAEHPVALELTAGWRRTLRLLWLAAPVLAVLGRNFRGPGARVMRLRRVDARTGGPVGIRSELTWHWLVQTLQSPQLSRRAEQRRREHEQAMEAEAARIAERYGDDPEARRRALGELYASGWGNRGRSCLTGVLARVAIICLPALLPPHQTLPDRLAGIVTIDERDARRHRRGGARRRTRRR